MRTTSMHLSLAAATALAMTTAAISPASAACTRLGFSVNDYGKDGPTADAKRLLDTYVAKWAKDNGIAKYTTGKKDVKCELFLDFGLFDEHTCRAEASVCWEGPPVKAQIEAKAKAQSEGTATDTAATEKTASEPKAKSETAKSEAAKSETAKSDGGKTEASDKAKTENKTAEKSAAKIETGSTTAPAEKAPKAKAEAPMPEKPEVPTGDSDPSSPNYGGSNPAAN